MKRGLNSVSMVVGVMGKRVNTSYTRDIKGEGPWKVGTAVISVLGCQGTHPEQAAEFAAWKFHLEQCGESYPTRDELQAIAREQGIYPEHSKGMLRSAQPSRL